LKDELGLKKIDEHPELTEHMWSEIDGTDKGKVSRDAMFHHLKEARDINIVEDAHINQVNEEQKAKVASILASVPIKKADNEEEEAFGEVDEEKKIDAKWQKKMKRAMTITINEDDHPCWAEVDAIWAEYSLANDAQLSNEQAKDYVRKYAREKLGMTTKSEKISEQLLGDILKDIDTANSGQISWDEMFNHLKRTREVDFDRLQESEGE